MEYILNNRKTNMEPENGGPLEEEIPIKNPSFSGSMLVYLGGIYGCKLEHEKAQQIWDPFPLIPVWVGNNFEYT